MKKVSLISAIASVAAAAAVLWSMPAAADVDRVEHNSFTFFGIDKDVNSNTSTSTTPTTGVPEPGTVVLFALGLGTLGFVTLRRKRVRA